ncbi:MAG: hypothetical protein COB36_12510 [Alphaproteobacteria bacterium]|nr:MAG: hypothetical protein COB36_12510 [Alphaproteobacteria bacterium]
MIKTLLISVAICAIPNIGFAQTPAKPLPEPSFSNDQPWPKAVFEIFRLAPGQHEAFVRSVAAYDEVSASVGLPPTRLYFHDHGDEWDVLMLKIIGEHEITPEMHAAMAAKTKELGLPSGPAFFLESRKNYASHKDTHTTGPISAAQWLARVDEWRQDNLGQSPLPPK